MGVGAERQAEKENRGRVGEVGERVMSSVWEIPILKSKRYQTQLQISNWTLSNGVSPAI